MLPPIKVRICDRDSNMNLSQIAPIKIKLREIEDDEVNNPKIHPIKIKICDRDKNMLSAYETKKARVRQKDGRVLIKDKSAILATDEILEVLSSDYIKPIRIKLSTLDMVYNWLYDLLFKFNFISVIAAGYAIVISYIKFVFKLFHKAEIVYALSEMFANFVHSVKFKHSIEVALDIFKVEGLVHSLKFKHSLNIWVTYTEKNLLPIKLQFKLPDVEEVAVIRKVPKTIGDITTGTIEDQFLGDKTILDVLYNFEELNPDGTPITK